MLSSSCAWPFREVCCRLVKDIDALQLVHFVREAQGFQNTRTSFFERVTAVTEYYGVLERVVQPKEKSYEVGAFRDEASCFLGVSSYVNDTFWKNGMVFQSLFHGLEISFDCLPHGTIGFGQSSLEVHSWVEGEHYRGSAVHPVSPNTSDGAIRVRGHLP